MINNNEYIIRKAILSDIDFIVDTIISAEKSGTNNLGLAKFFELSEFELRTYLKIILSEEIDGCEFSLSSFLVATYQNQPISALGGWIEGDNEANLPSSILKSNLISFVFPKKNIIKSKEKKELVELLQIEREQGTYQIEYGYTLEEYRGKNLFGKILDKHINIAINNKIKKIQVHVFNNNQSSIDAHIKKGFRIIKKYHSDNPLTLEYFPSNENLLMEKEIG